MKQMLIVKADRCLGCKSCEMACAVEHSEAENLEGAIQAQVKPQSRVRVMQGEGFAIPLQCRQCEDAACIASCPTQALCREEAGPVILDADRCIGCMWCVEACPFGVITMDNYGSGVVKCDQCYERVAQGKTPACVKACPTSAITYQDLKEVVADKRSAYLVRIERAAREEAL